MKCLKCKGRVSLIERNEVWSGFRCDNCNRPFAKIKKSLHCYQTPCTKRIIDRAIKDFQGVKNGI